MHADIERILLTHDQILARVRALAAQIAQTYSESVAGVTIVPILSGSIIFVADLIRELPFRMKVALVHISTYPGATTSPGTPRTVMPPVGDVTGRDVLILDDILDSGRTLRHVRETLTALRPASIRTAVLLRKPGRASGEHADFVGFDIEDSFVVGYGLDYNDFYRNFPHIGVLRPELIR